MPCSRTRATNSLHATPRITQATNRGHNTVWEMARRDGGVLTPTSITAPVNARGPSPSDEIQGARAAHNLYSHAEQDQAFCCNPPAITTARIWGDLPTPHGAAPRTVQDEASTRGTHATSTQ
uniref:Uncharacterized protein n=1 Tax=Zea mays TaxID=4577 RepID=A0A804QUF1_MAIZE